MHKEGSVPICVHLRHLSMLASPRPLSSYFDGPDWPAAERPTLESGDRYLPLVTWVTS
jgi:hypothetical protein